MDLKRAIGKDGADWRVKIVFRQWERKKKRDLWLIYRVTWLFCGYV